MTARHLSSSHAAVTDRLNMTDRLTVSDEAQRGISHICATRGPQVILASWPGGAAYLPRDLYTNSPFDVVIGQVAGCPIYADSRQLDYYADRRAVLDLTYMDLDQNRPMLLLRDSRTNTYEGAETHAVLPRAARKVLALSKKRLMAS